MTTPTSTALKDRLQAIAKQEFAVPTDETEREQLITAMLANIGNPDPELRDDLIYMTLGSWCYYGRLRAARRRRLLQTLLDDEHLFYRLGERDSESVLTRSFSALLLPTILAGHRQQPFLEGKEIEQVKERVLVYLRGERDRRGYLPGLGWAHAAAHTGDALGALAQMEEVDGEGLAEILDGIHFLATAAERGYAEGEDGRLAAATIRVLERKVLEAGQWLAWLERFAPAEREEGPFPADFYRRLNARHFLSSLYFRLRRPEVREKAGESIAERLAVAVEATVGELGG